jgi:tRNA A-37 threonylcarbamoyl transferase component Bud32
MNGTGLNLELVKIIGFQIAAVLRLFSMNGLGLIHGSITPMNIFFRKSGVPEFKLVDFSHAFFLDEQPDEIS